MKKNYSNEEFSFSGCPGCAYANYEFSLPCGLAYDDENFIISQDWELPIEGFMILSPKRHVENLSELTKNEKNMMIDLIDKTIRIMKDNDICDKFDVIFEEKENRHFHVWILPRHKWMSEMFSDVTGNLLALFNYAKNNFHNEETYKKIKSITEIIKTNMKGY